MTFILTCKYDRLSLLLGSLIGNKLKMQNHKISYEKKKGISILTTN